MIADLKNRELLAHTLVVVAGDHGEAFGEHGENGHGIFCYDESVKVPLLFSNPALLKKPARNRSRVCLVDIMPSVLTLLGVPPADNAQGQNLEELMSGDGQTAPRPVYLESMYGRELNNWAPLTALVSGQLQVYFPASGRTVRPAVRRRGEVQSFFSRTTARPGSWTGNWPPSSPPGRSRAGQEPNRLLQAEDKKKLAALGYISSFAATGRSALDPKIGIGYQNRFSELVTALDRGEIDRVEAEALRLRDETVAFKLPFAYVMLDYVYERKRSNGTSSRPTCCALAKFSAPIRTRM